MKRNLTSAEKGSVTSFWNGLSEPTRFDILMAYGLQVLELILEKMNRGSVDYSYAIVSIISERGPGAFVPSWAAALTCDSLRKFDIYMLLATWIYERHNLPLDDGVVSDHFFQTIIWLIDNMDESLRSQFDEKRFVASVLLNVSCAIQDAL